MPPREGFEKCQWDTEEKSRPSFIHHPQSATGMGRHVPKSSRELGWGGKESGVCVCVCKDIEKFKSQFHFHSLLHFYRKKRENSSLTSLKQFNHQLSISASEVQGVDHCCTDLLSMLSLQLDSGLR